MFKSAWKHFDGKVPCQGYEIFEDACRIVKEKNEDNLEY